MAPGHVFNAPISCFLELVACHSRRHGSFLHLPRVPGLEARADSGDAPRIGGVVFFGVFGYIWWSFWSGSSVGRAKD